MKTTTTTTICRYTNAACLRFIIIGNDYNWNVKNIFVDINKTDEFIFVSPITLPGNIGERFYAAVDLCILSMCNHTIATTGWLFMFSGFLQKNAAFFVF
jgi:hypothetical protein